MKRLLDHIIVQYLDGEYAIYTDGVVYNATVTDNPVPADIPELIFKLRDVYVRSFQ